MCDWDDDTSWIGFKGRPYLTEPSGRRMMIAFDTSRTNDRSSGVDATLCNRSRHDGSTCRLLKDHDGPHIPISGELIATTGIYLLGEM